MFLYNVYIYGLNYDWRIFSLHQIKYTKIMNGLQYKANCLTKNWYIYIQNVLYQVSELLKIYESTDVISWQ